MMNETLTQSKSNVASYLCRDCDMMQTAPKTGDLSFCSACYSMRLIQHDELNDLDIAHLDCDAFFAALEKRDDPSLKDKPLIIGGGKRGVVSTCCYIARTYGVHSAMPMFKALKLCPNAEVRPPNGPAIREASHLILEEMRALTPLVQPLSVDEAFLDLKGTHKLHKAAPAAMMSKLVRRIEKKVGITSSVGLSHNKFLAKIASDLDKPRGFAVIGKAETLSFLRDKPINFIYGVGKSFTEKLRQDGFNTIGDLQNADAKELAIQYGEHGYRLAKLSRGEDNRPVNPDTETKSISSETTFNTDIRDYETLEDKLWPLAEKISKRMKYKGFNGRVVTLKLKTAHFKTFTRRQTLEHPTNLANIIFETAQHLLKTVIIGPRAVDAYRLIGINMSDLDDIEATGQSFLFMEKHNHYSAMEKAIDGLRAKFGDDAVSSGRMLKNTLKTKKENNER